MKRVLMYVQQKTRRMLKLYGINFTTISGYYTSMRMMFTAQVIPEILNFTMFSSSPMLGANLTATYVAADKNSDLSSLLK